jgi:hypothetical protein
VKFFGWLRIASVVGGGRLAGMKQILLMIALVALVGQSVLAVDKKPLTKEESTKVIEAAIRKAAGKPTGELPKWALEKVTSLYLGANQLTDLKGLEKLTHLTVLELSFNQLADDQLRHLAGLKRLQGVIADEGERVGLG